MPEYFAIRLPVFCLRLPFARYLFGRTQQESALYFVQKHKNAVKRNFLLAFYRAARYSVGILVTLPATLPVLLP